jgi:hypothetical protein
VGAAKSLDEADQARQPCANRSALPAEAARNLDRANRSTINARLSNMICEFMYDYECDHLAFVLIAQSNKAFVNKNIFTDIN